MITHALTLRPPWGQAVIFGPKRVENRKARPPSALLGRRIAIHSGLTPDLEGADWIDRNGLWVEFDDRTDLVRGAIIGSARLVGITKESTDPWFTGPWGWLLDEVIALPLPVYCRGQLGLWAIPPALRFSR